ncbi:MAG: metallophosphoesterase [Armatimonadota bacterium]
MHWQAWSKIGLGVLLGAAIFRGVANSRKLQVREETACIPDLPEQFAGFRLLQISDLHLPRRSNMIPLLLEHIVEIDPDLLCLTGDFVFTALSLQTVDAFLTALAPRRVLGVLGNADYRPGITDADRQRWERQITLLNNRAIRLDRGDDHLWIAGVDDPHQGRDSLLTALEAVPAAAPTILLAHSPEVILRGIDPRIRLILSGHTHGGQICLPNGNALYTNTSLPRRYASGWHTLGNAQMYVSRGVASTRVPLRYGCPPEITLFTLLRCGKDEG